MKTTKLLPLIILSIILISTFQLTIAQNEKAKANFIYCFARNITWPSNQGDFIITVIGDDAVTAELRKFTANKSIGSQKIVINQINSISEIGKCKILFIPQSESSIISQLNQTTRNKSILVVSEHQNACKLGSGINLVKNGDKLAFEISESNIGQRGLQIGKIFLQLGKVTN